MISIQTLIILLLLNLFILGIKSISASLFFRSNILSLNNTNSSSNYAIASLLGIFIYCFLINFILILPSCLFLLDTTYLNLKYFIDFVLHFIKLLFILISFLGLIDLLNFRLWKISISENHSERKYTKDLIISLIICTALYLLLAPKSISSGMVYDTGLYHLPFINHISNYTVEPGLANLHFRYGFYGLPFYGQIPIQSFYKNSEYISPSINIGFLAIYFSYFLSYLRNIKFNFLIDKKFIFNENIEEISIIYFLISLIFYTGGVFKSLSSYSLDLPLFICGSLIFHLLLISKFRKNKNLQFYLPILWLSFFAPLVKLTGIVITFYSCLFFAISILKFFGKKFIKNRKFSKKFLMDFFLKDFFAKVKLFSLRNSFNYKLTLVIFVGCTTIYIFNNMIITGYPFFPLDFLGPIHKFSINSNSLDITRTTLLWHRYQGGAITSGNWVGSYLLTRNGLINIIFWFLPSILNLIYIFYRHRLAIIKPHEINVVQLFIPLFMVQIICFFLFIPLVNYYPWIPHCSIFLLIMSSNRVFYSINPNINFVKITLAFLILFMISNSFLSFSNREILANIPNSIFKEPILKNPDKDTFELKPKNWVPLKDYYNNRKSKISIPKNTDQCWGIEPPCTFSIKEIN